MLQPVTKEWTLRGILSSLWLQRRFIVLFVKEKRKSEHHGTYFGSWWEVIDPILWASLYYVIFGVVLSVNKGIDNFLLFLVIGVFVFRSSSSVVSQSIRGFARYGAFYDRRRVPPAISPIIIAIDHLVAFRHDFLVICFVAIFASDSFSFRIAFVPFAMVLQFSSSLTIGLILANIRKGLPDIENLIGVSIRVLRYISGVMIPIGKFDDHFPVVIRQVLRYNPFALVLDGYRWCFGFETNVSIATLAIIAVTVTGVLLPLAALSFSRKSAS